LLISATVYLMIKLGKAGPAKEPEDTPDFSPSLVSPSESQ
jgi:hypothetical protein